MSNSTEGEYDNIWLPFSISGIFTLVGLLIQFFMVAVNVNDWLKGRMMKATDQIITSLGIARSFCLISSLLHMISSLYCTKKTFCVFILFTWQTSDFSSIWLSALLSIFFCFKISNFHNHFFLRLRVIISKRVVFLIFASVLLAPGYPLINLIFNIIFLADLSRYCILNYEKYIEIQSPFFVCSLFPLLIFFASSVLLVIFLCFHVSQMRSRRIAMSSTDTYQRAINFTVVSFLTCALCITVNVTENYGIQLFGIFWMYIIWNMFPVLYSICLIYITTKLRNRVCMIIHCGIDCLLRRNASNPKSGKVVETIPL